MPMLLTRSLEITRSISVAPITRKPSTSSRRQRRIKRSLKPWRSRSLVRRRPKLIERQQADLAYKVTRVPLPASRLRQMCASIQIQKPTAPTPNPQPLICVIFASGLSTPIAVLGFSKDMRRAIYPGSFDPVTNGHLDIIARGCKLFDEIIIAILVNPEKRPFFTIEERREMLLEVTAEINKGSCRLLVEDFQGLLVEYAIARQADAIVRGIRAISDYEYELQMALMNRRLEPRIETVFMMPAEAYSYVSSRLVKEVAQLGGAITGLVPPLVEARMRAKLGQL